ncbi:hypothetical protein M4951_07850 [Blastopirellula sp. J2-11]|uniref:hypothetical protein n=1 Tax=Blastopirellula sp. J2-11 TaxID=2943192 RepID=UPI0021C63CB2|nr:hypothetical protein [Blastopirellula sp. J2-11]UUO08222.1 hypothetical protein M4951_07850 [Blastopirellula sp. J2-11]
MSGDQINDRSTAQLADVNAGINQSSSGANDGGRPLVGVNAGLNNSANNRPTGRLVDVNAGINQSGSGANDGGRPLVGVNAGLNNSANNRPTGRLVDVNAGINQSGSGANDGGRPLVGVNAGLNNSANNRPTGRLVDVNAGINQSSSGANDGGRPLVGVNAGIDNSANNRLTERLVDVNAGINQSGSGANDGGRRLVGVNAGLNNSANNRPTGRLVDVNAGINQSSSGANDGGRPLVGVNAGLNNSANNRPTGRLVDVNAGINRSSQANLNEIVAATSEASRFRGSLHEAFARPLLGDVLYGEMAPITPPPSVREIVNEIDDGLSFIPGYWSFEPVEQKFVWVTGVLRRAPQGMEWVAGSWLSSENGFIRTAGYWKVTGEIKSLAEQGPHEIIAPVARVATATGVVKTVRHLDYLLEDRGILFAPIDASTLSMSQPNTVSITLTEPILIRNLLLHLFVDRANDRFYFGDYYGETGKSLGLIAWRKAGLAEGTLLGQYQKIHRLGNVDFERRLAGWEHFYESHREWRPPVNAAATKRLLLTSTEHAAVQTSALSRRLVANVLGDIHHSSGKSLRPQLGKLEGTATLSAGASGLLQNSLKSTKLNQTIHLQQSTLGSLRSQTSFKASSLGGAGGLSSTVRGLGGGLSGVGGAVGGGLNGVGSTVGGTVGGLQNTIKGLPLLSK